MTFFQERSSGELITRMSANARAAREMMNLLAVGSVGIFSPSSACSS